MEEFKEEWKSPRKIHQEEIEYQRQRFVWYMERVDAGEITEEEAIAELRSELEMSGGE